MATNTTDTQGIGKVIGASSVGTLIEWYDFYIFGSLASLIGKHLFPADAGAAALINTLAIFAAGFIVRPFGALVFGRLGDIVGRKYTFLLTLVLMGGATFLIGLVPPYEQIGYAAPIIVLLLRLLQGLALGGEYGGAATYVAEHAPANKRGYYTSFIQTTATLGLFLSLGVIVLTKNIMGKEGFEAPWGGWRVPFIISVFLVGVSIYIRLKMAESPAFVKVKAEGNISKNPLAESFRNKDNFKMVLLALFGAVMGQGVIWYTGQFYAQSFIENVCKLDFNESRYIIIIAIMLATPFFIVFASWSDKVGRKWIMLAGMLFGILTYRPIYTYFLDATKVAAADGTEMGAPKVKAAAIKGSQLKLQTTTTSVSFANGIIATKSSVDTLAVDGTVKSKKPVVTVIDKKLPSGMYWTFIFLVFIQIIYVTMVYGPIAAFLVELFPTRIRYTSMSLPYHVGNGVFGGLVPFIGTLVVEMTKTPTDKVGDPLAGLWYPMGVAIVCFVIGAVFLGNKSHENDND